MENMIKPYGDTINDGIVQLSFTLPVKSGAKAKKAAEIYANKLNIEDIVVAHMEEIAEGFTYFVMFGKAVPSLDYNSVKATEVKTEFFSYYEINDLIRERLNKKVVVVGASIGTDAHTVGIDAIMNMKGYNGDYGLERYPEMDAFNMGSQVSSEELVKKAVEKDADAILVSQTVTQKDSHIRNFTELIELLEAEKIRDRFLLLAGGARITNDLAIELGYDAGFGPGTLPSHVGSYIVTALQKNKRGKNYES